MVLVLLLSLCLSLLGSAIRADGASAPQASETGTVLVKRQPVVIVVDCHGFLLRLDIASFEGITQIISGAFPALKNSVQQFFTYPLDIQRWKAALVPVHPSQPECEVVKALHEAKQNGCVVILFSNITPAEHARLVERHPELRLSELFDDEIRLSELCTHPNGHLVSKRDAQFHDACAKLIAQKYAGARVIFFDDQQANLDRFRTACAAQGLSCEVRLARSPEQSVRDIRAISGERAPLARVEPAVSGAAARAQETQPSASPGRAVAEIDSLQ